MKIKTKIKLKEVLEDSKAVVDDEINIIDELIKVHEAWQKSLEQHKFIIDRLEEAVSTGNEKMINYWYEKFKESRKIIQRYRNDLSPE